MIAQGQQSQLKGILALLEEYQKPPVDELIKTLGLPSWFNTEHCVIVMNKAHESYFKQYNLSWLWFIDYIDFSEMVVMDKRATSAPLTNYYPR